MVFAIGLKLANGEAASPRQVRVRLVPRLGGLSVCTAAWLEPDAYPLLTPALRRPLAAGARLALFATGPVDLGFVSVESTTVDGAGWPGTPGQ